MACCLREYQCGWRVRRGEVEVDDDADDAPEQLPESAPAEPAAVAAEESSTAEEEIEEERLRGLNARAGIEAAETAAAVGGCRRAGWYSVADSTNELVVVAGIMSFEGNVEAKSVMGSCGCM